jgi:hypothetical protein
MTGTGAASDSGAVSVSAISLWAGSGGGSGAGCGSKGGLEGVFVALRTRGSIFSSQMCSADFADI